MALDSQFLDMMGSTVGIQNPSALSTDGLGVKTYPSPQIPVKARIEYSSKLIKGKDGRDVISPITVYTPPFDNFGARATLTIEPTARVWLPAGTSPLNASSSSYFPPVIRTYLHFDEQSQPFYWEINLGA